MSKQSQDQNRLFKQKFSQAGDVITKRMTAVSTITTSVAGSIFITSITSDSVRTIPASEWTNFAARYQSFRVQGIRVTLIPTQPVQSSTIIHGLMALSDSLSGNGPATFGQMISDENSKFFSTFNKIVYATTWSKNPGAKLWSNTTGAIPSQNQFAVNYDCNDTLTGSTKYYDVVFEWIVQFRGSE